MKKRVFFCAMLLLLVAVLASCAPQIKASQPRGRATAKTSLPSPVATTPSSVSPTATPPVTSVLPTATPRPTLTPTPLADPASLSLSTADKAIFVSETIPDYSKVAPGAVFTKSWTLRNVGSTTWTQDYRLVRGASVPHAVWGGNNAVALTQKVSPGQEATFSVKLTAPKTVGIYTLYWLLLNPQDKIVPIGLGKRVWVTVRVCEAGTPCPTPPPASGVAGSTAKIGKITAKLIALEPGATTTAASFCLYNLPNRNYIPLDMAMLVDGKRYRRIGGGSLVLQPGKACFRIIFGVSAAQIDAAHSVSVVIGQVRMAGPNYPERRCREAHDKLVKKYPGLDFTCHFTMGGYYTNLKLPPGMSYDKADQIINDAVEGAIYGPWVLKVK